MSRRRAVRSGLRYALIVAGSREDAEAILDELNARDFASWQRKSIGRGA
jgi:hypothetical protein